LCFSSLWRFRVVVEYGLGRYRAFRAFERSRWRRGRLDSCCTLVRRRFIFAVIVCWGDNIERVR
jgi:hypothetical protein